MGISVTQCANEREQTGLSRFRKTATVGADVTTCGRLVQRWLPTTGKARMIMLEQVRRVDQGRLPGGVSWRIYN